MLAFLEGASPSPFAPYKPSIETTKRRAGRVRGLLVDVPGESRHQEKWDSVLLLLARASNPVIVNVVSYGFHAPSRLERSSLLPYLRERRDLELESVSFLVKNLEAFPQPVSMLTVATKEDLWWGQHDKVDRHYRGKYQRIVNRLQLLRGRTGPRRFCHYFASASLLIANFVDRQGFVVRETARSYDDRLKLLSHERLVGALRASADR